MSDDNSYTEQIARIFEEYCKGKGYQVKAKNLPNNDIRLDISNLQNRANVTVYHTSSIVVGGSPNTLKTELESLKIDFEKDSNKYITKPTDIKSCAMRYDIMLSSLRKLVKSKLDTIKDVNVTLIENPGTNKEYSARVQRLSYSVALTQYSNGTLLLQGKTDAIFSDCCDLIESLCNPSEKEVISRFISGNQESLDLFAIKYTPKLIEVAEIQTKKSLGVVYDYLESYDRKWFIASECICITEMPLPEYSPIVMPASKAFEGFAKKLLVSIGLCSEEYFKGKNSNFSILKDSTNPQRKSICDKDKYTNTYLNRLNVCLDLYRNFMMHSDEAKVTKIESPEEAREMLDNIYRETKEIFEYFNDLYKLI